MRMQRVRRAAKNPQMAKFHIQNEMIPSVYRKPATYGYSNFKWGQNIFDRDWDVLILLDTCRVDALKEVEDEYDFLTNIHEISSVGGSTLEWTANTFTQERKSIIKDTAYLTPNGWAKKMIEDRELERKRDDHPGLRRIRKFGNTDLAYAGDFGLLEHIWKYVPENKDKVGAKALRKILDDKFNQGRAPPRFLTDRGVAVAREHDFDRLILHYIQPHAPYVGKAIEEVRPLEEHEKNPFRYLHNTGHRDLVWQSYLNELRRALDEIQIVLQNIDADTVAISADHGEAFGEYGIYGHHTGTIHPKIRTVPWVETTAADENTFEPEIEPQDSRELSVDQTLSALGYK